MAAGAKRGEPCCYGIQPNGHFILVDGDGQRHGQRHGG